jgi:ribosomal-protein-serine acetyltransferase
MDAFPVDRTRPPSRVVYRDGARHLELRPWAFADVDALIAAIDQSNPELRRFMPWAHGEATREGYYTLVAKFQADYWAGREYVLGMFSERAEVLGGIGLHPRVPLNPAGLEVGYWCHSAHSGRGWTSLATRMLVALAFDRFGCDRFQVIYDEANVGSRRVIEKCGLPFEGTIRNATAVVSPEVRSGGYAGTGRHRMHALTPDDLGSLEWLEGVRANTTTYDALGGVSPRP